MKDVMDVLRAKEQELQQVKMQIEALRIALPLLGDEGTSPSSGIAAVAPSKNAQRVVQLP
jgi:hypothetical protein